MADKVAVVVSYGAVFMVLMVLVPNFLLLLKFVLVLVLVLILYLMWRLKWMQ